MVATNNLDAIIAAKPDYALYCAMGNVRPREALADMRGLLEAGINVVGSSPGFVTDLLPVALASTCQSISQMRTMEIADSVTYDVATVMFDVMGFGNPIGDRSFLYQPDMLNAALGVDVDEIRDAVEQEPAPEDFDVAVLAAAGRIVNAIPDVVDAAPRASAPHPIFRW